jgi:hypothetical protein
MLIRQGDLAEGRCSRRPGDVTLEISPDVLRETVRALDEARDPILLK